MIAGIDYSTHTVDVVLLDDDTDQAAWFRRRIDDKTGALEAARAVRDVMPVRGRWRDEGVVAIGIEDPFSKGLATVKALAMIKGALVVCLPGDIPVYELAPMSWKKRFVGRGDATKGTVAEHGARFFANCPSGPPRNQDTYDALGIAYAAREIHDEKTTDHEEEAA